MDVLPLEGYWTPHEAVVEAKTGDGAYGPVYAAPGTVACFVVEEQQLVRNSDGEEVVSSTQVYLGFDVVAPPGSRVTVWPGTAQARTSTVIASAHGAHPTLPAFQTLKLE